jgi:hypothetical protein
MRARLLIALGAVVALAAIAGASAAQVERLPPRYVSSAASQRAAQRDMKRRLAHLSLPPGGRLVGAHSPLAAKRLRGRYPFISSAAFHLVWKTRFAFSGAPIRQTLSWFVHHPPPGSELAFSTNGPPRQPGPPWYRCRYFELPVGRPEIGERGMTVCGTEAHGGTSIRIDVEAEWLEGRSPFERIPGGSRYLEVIVTSPKKRYRRATVTDRKLISHVVAIVNSLPLTQHTSYTCPHGIEGHSPPHPAVTMIFRARRHGDPIARLYQSLPVESGCRPLHFQLRGRSERGLDEGWLVIRALDATIQRARPIGDLGFGE